jgi:hypothetical protein
VPVLEQVREPVLEQEQEQEQEPVRERVLAQELVFLLLLYGIMASRSSGRTRCR